MMSNLYIEEGDLIQLDSVSLPVATYTKFQPQSTDFLDITDPKAVYPLLLYFFNILIREIACSASVSVWCK